MVITSFSINALPAKHKSHRHREYECHYIIDGEGYVMTGPPKKLETIKKGDFVLIYPDHEHFLESRDDRAHLIQMMWTFHWEEKDHEIKDDVSRYLGSGKIKQVKEMMIAYFEKMRFLNDSQSPMLNKQANLLLELFLYSLMEENHVGINLHGDELLQLCLKEMYSRIRTDFSVKDFAEKSGIAPSQFIRNFKALFNTTPYRYYQEMKITALFSYLKENRVTLDVAAEKFGFSDRFHLSKVFKRIKKMSPSQYIK